LPSKASWKIPKQHDANLDSVRRKTNQRRPPEEQKNVKVNETQEDRQFNSDMNENPQSPPEIGGNFLRKWCP